MFGTTYADRSVPTEPEQEQPEPPPAVQDRLPPRIQAALFYVKSCMDYVRPMPMLLGSIGQDSVETVVPELHPAQESAMRLACMALGNFFMEEVPVSINVCEGEQ